MRSFRARATRGTDATSKRGGRTLRTQGFSAALLEKLDAARAAGKFGEAEIALLKEKLSIVVGAFQSERGRRERELEALGSAASVELCEREYALSSARLELCEARRLIKILEAREESARDDLDEALTGNEVLKAQLMDEHERAEMMGRETGQLRDALRDARAALERAAEREEEREAMKTTIEAEDVEMRVKREAMNARLARLEEKIVDSREENTELNKRLRAVEGENSELQRAVAERDGAQNFLKSQLADWNQRLYARADGVESEVVDGTTTSYASESSAELRSRLDHVEIELGAKTGAVVALERRVKEQDKALERARAELEKMREKLLARDDEAFERDLAARSRGRDRSKYAAAAEHTAAEVMETLRKSRERQAEKRGRDARASRRAGGRSTKGAQSRVAERSVAKKRAPPSSVAIDASAPYQPPTANDDDDDEYVDDDDKDDENDSEYEEVDVPIKRASKFPLKKKKKSIAPTTAKENAAEDAAPANDGPRMPLGMLQMPTLGAKKNKGVDGEQQKKRRLNRQSAIPEALPSLMFGGAVEPAA